MILKAPLPSSIAVGNSAQRRSGRLAQDAEKVSVAWQVLYPFCIRVERMLSHILHYAGIAYKGLQDSQAGRD